MSIWERSLTKYLLVVAIVVVVDGVEGGSAMAKGRDERIGGRW